MPFTRIKYQSLTWSLFLGVLLVLFGPIRLTMAEDQDIPLDEDPLLKELPTRPFSFGPKLLEEKAAPKAPSQPSFHFDMLDWNQMRKAVEKGQKPGVPLADVEASTADIKIAKPKPPPGQLHVELPYESSLSVTGRKVIKVELKNTHITQEKADELGVKQDEQTFNMEQELQARIQGTVARKTTINVNFDDTKDNVRDFSVVYKGDPDEVVQEAAFGDITLSLPATEFVNYNKQLFGIRAKLKYKRAGLQAIGSRTKGDTETRRFTGQTERIQQKVNDTNYIQRKFYDLNFPNATAMQTLLSGQTILPISDAVNEVVLMEDVNGLLDTTVAPFFDIAVPTAPATSINLKMRQLSPGVDYSFDRLNGIITFTNQVAENVRVAVDYTLNNGVRLSSLAGGTTVAILIKDTNPETAQVSQEIKRFYSVGARNITRDNGIGNFVFRVLDANGETDIGDNLIPLQRYPDTIDMDFETGIFELQERLPFNDVYAQNVNTGEALNVIFQVEYNSIIRTFVLRPNVVLQSEKVQVDGRLVTRDVDYFIDYDIGIITFFNEDLIREETVVEVTYEFAPFGGQLGETLVGARGTYDILENKKYLGVGIGKWDVGSTVLYNFAAKPNSPPDIRSTPSSLLVTEGDTTVEGLTIGNLPLLTNFTLERAKSQENPNLFGKALIDSMEGIKQEDSPPMLEDAWEVAANPPTGTHNTVVDFRGRTNADSHLRWLEVDLNTTDPNDGSATQKALNVAYDLNTLNTTLQEQVSIVQPISIAGRDFSKKTTLEIEIEGAGADAAGAGVDFLVDIGTFNEDADGDGLLDTEDAIPFDGVLNLGEDNGWTFNGPGPDLSATITGDNIPVSIGASNTRLDSEDLNGDRLLGTSELPATFSPIFSLNNGGLGQTTVTGETFNDLSFSGRKLFQIPLDLASLSTEEQARLTGVKQIRITIRNNNAATTARSGSVNILRVSLVGITWEPAEITGNTASTMTVRAVNSKDDAGVYGTVIGQPAYADLYKDSTPSLDSEEQALDLDFELLDGTTATTKNVFSASRDLSRHDQFRFFLSKRNSCSANCGEFFLQAGSESEFQQFNMNVSEIATNPQWTTVIISQRDLNNDGSPETWVTETPNSSITRVGNVRNLSQITQFKAGIVNTTGGTIDNEVYLNEIHLSGAHEREGNASRVQFDTTWTNWADFGGGRRKVDRLWQTPTTSITNQDKTQENAYLNFNRISFLPMTFNTTRDETITPSAFQSNSNALVSFLEEGRVENVNNAATAKLVLPKLPILDFSYSGNFSENNVTQRRQNTENYRLGSSYSPRTRFDLLPGKFLTFKPIPRSITGSYSIKKTKLRFPGVNELNRFGISTAPFVSTNLTQISETGEGRMSFKPWSGFSFNPSYKLTTQTEVRDFRDDEKAARPELQALDDLETPRSIAQSVDASGNLRIFKWLDPRYSFSFTGSETNGLPTLSNTTAYTLKSITRNSRAEVSGAVQVTRVIPKSRLLKSLNVNGSHRLENGDSYENMPENFRWRSKLWVGDELDVSTGTSAQRTSATDRRTSRLSSSWLPWSGFDITRKRLKPLSTLSLTTNYQISKEETETTGSTKRVNSKTWPDMVVTLNDTEDFVGIKKIIDNSRLVFRTNKRVVETIDVSRNEARTMGTDYQFKFWQWLDFSTSFNLSETREDNLLTNQLSSLSETRGYAFQTRIPWGSWSFTPRYERNETDARDATQPTNDLVAEVYTLQIYSDITKPFGIRFGRREIGIANRLILNSTLKWDKKRSAINPQSNHVDIYSATLSGDYTISKNFRLAVGGSFSQEEHHPEFAKEDKTEFGINSTLTIQF